MSLERRQVWIYLAAILTGLVVGTAAPSVGSVAEAVLWPTLVLLLYATFTQVRLLHLREALRDARFAAAVLLGNFVVLPLVVWALLQVLPEDPAIRLGVLLVLLVPCTDWFITFTQLGGGDVPRAIAVTPVLLALQLLLLPAYVFLMARTEVTGVITPGQAAPALLIVVVPLAMAALTEWWIERTAGRGVVRDRLAWGPVPLLAVVVFLIATAQVDTVRGALDVMPVIVPVFVAFLAIAGLAGKLLTRIFTLPAPQGRTLTFSLATRNSFVVLPFALALPAGLEVAAVVVVAQSLIELLGMVVFLWWVPHSFTVRPPDRGRAADAAG
jgi:ACR3 family arsenite transporter